MPPPMNNNGMPMPRAVLGNLPPPLPGFPQLPAQLLFGSMPPGQHQQPPMPGGPGLGGPGGPPGKLVQLNQ